VSLVNNELTPKFVCCSVLQCVAVCCSVLQCVTSREVSLVNNVLTPHFTISKMYCVKTSKTLCENIHSIGTDEVSLVNDELTTAVLGYRFHVLQYVVVCSLCLPCARQ